MLHAALTSIVAIAAAMRALVILSWYPRLAFVFSAAWGIWFAVSFSLYGDEAYAAVVKSAAEAAQNTSDLIDAAGRTLYSYIRFTMPFFLDLAHLALRIWLFLTWRQRLVLLFATIILSGINMTYQAMKKRKTSIFNVIFQLLFLLVAPAAWWMTEYISLSSMQVLCGVLVIYEPLILATAAYANCLSATERSGRKSVDPIYICGEWVRYFTFAPVLLALLSSTIQDNKQALRGLFVFTLWLQSWSGARVIYALLPNAGSASRKIVSRLYTTVWRQANDAVVALDMPKIGMLLRHIGSIAFAHKMAAAIIGALVLAIIGALFYKALEAVSHILTIIMWAGASIESSQLLYKDISIFYKRRLAFWVFALFLSRLALLPFVGSFIRLLFPILFGLAFFVGDSILTACIYILRSKTRDESDHEHED